MEEDKWATLGENESAKEWLDKRGIKTVPKDNRTFPFSQRSLNAQKIIDYQISKGIGINYPFDKSQPMTQEENDFVNEYLAKIEKEQ
jgi:hypothetical protein